MPIRPDQLERYPDDWEERAHAAKERAGWRCQCTGECGRTLDHLLPGDGRCRNVQGQAKWSHSGPPTIVVLTCAHLDQRPENVDDENLRAFCPGCHLSYDSQPGPRAYRWAERLVAAGAVTLFDVATLAG